MCAPYHHRSTRTESLNEEVEEVLNAAGELTDAVAACRPDAAKVVGVDLREVHSSGTGVRADRETESEGIEITGVNAGVRPPAAPDGAGGPSGW